MYDKLPHKTNQIIRITFININGLPQDKDNVKNRQIYNTLQKTQTDIIGFTETNLRWHKLPQRDQWRERTQGMWESSHTSIGYNFKDSGTSKFQPGGTMTLSIGKASHRVVDKGEDPTGLGRWSWTRYRGTENIATRIITAYRPCLPSNPGPTTVYSQHLRYLDSTDDERCPREAMLADLLAQVNIWRTGGDQIILLMDCNTDVNNPTFKARLLTVGLTEAITNDRETSAPTHNRGSTAIDGIFTSHTLQTKASGYLPFGNFPSDHRAIWIDVTCQSAFGSTVGEAVRPHARRLKSDDPKIRRRFNKEYETFITEHRLEERLYSLQERITLTPSPTETQELDDIFTLRRQGLERAESKCRKLRMGAVPYSQEFSKASKTIELWRAVATKKSGAKYSMTKLRRLEKCLHLHNCLNTPIQDVPLKLKNAYKTYWEVKKDATNHRATYLEAKANDQAEEQGNNSDNVYRQLINREAQRLAAQRVRATLKKMRGGGVTRIEVMDDNGIWQERTTKEEIENGCIDENIKKYRQTENTSSMQAPLRDFLGSNLSSPAIDSILRGDVTLPPDTPVHTRELLHEFRQANHLQHPAPRSIITTEDFRTGWRKMKERTSSGLSGIHFGHMKAASFNQRLSDFEATIAHIPYCSGYVPTSWKKGVCCMLKKKRNVDQVTKLRTIVLTEADYNFNNKKLGRDSIRHAEKNNLIAPEQYGSRKGRNAVVHALNKRLSYDLIRQSRKPGSLCSNDAKSCYDRVIHSIVTLAFKRIGIEDPPVKCMLQCIQQMEYHIRTSFGDSASSFSSKHLEIPFQGILQGNGAAPTIWVLVSTPLLNMLRTAGNGAHILSAISKESSHIVGFAFVDDTDLITFNMHDNQITMADIATNMQESIDRWEGGLHATGGAIVPEKSWIYSIDFKFLPSGKWEYKTVEEIDTEFTVKDHRQERLPLKQIEANEGKCTLGVILAADGNNDDAIRDMRKKAETWHDYIRTGHLQANEARLAMDTTIMKTLEYPLLALTLTEAECTCIMAPVLAAGLTKSHICRTFPRAVVYGPKKERGLGMHNLYTTQGTSHLSAIVQFITAKDHLTGQLIRASIESAKIEIGISGNLFTYNYTEFGPLLTESWIKSVWKFLSANDIRLEETMTGNSSLRRENDSFIMEKVVSTGTFRPAELQHINRCRLYLQVCTQSDVTTGDGLQFSPLAYRCEFDPCISHHSEWPRQNRPGIRSRRLWKNALNTAYPRLEQTIIRQLGRWIDMAERTNWKWFYHHRTQRLYQRHRNTWRTYHRVSRAGAIGNRPKFRYFSQAFSLPPHSWRATVIRSNALTYVLTGSSPEARNQEMTPTLTTIGKRRRRAMGEELKVTDQDLQAIISAIRTNTLRIVSDGSYEKTIELGTAAWIFATGREVRGTGKHMTPGDPTEQCSHRSELSGILGAILQTNDFCFENGINTGSVELRCDGLGAVNIVQYLHETISPSRKHFDLITSINDALKQSPLKWQFNHVPGHQDDLMDNNLLGDWEYLNTIADKEAKSKLFDIRQMTNWQDQRPMYLPNERCSIFSTNPEGRNVKIGSNLTKTIYDHVHTKEIRDYWKHKGHYERTTERFIDWTVPARSCSALAPSRQKWLVKWITGMCGVGARLKQWKWQSHSNCPRCLMPNEKVKHVLQCPQTSSTELWNESIVQLRQWLSENQCHPDMAASFCTSLESWRNNLPMPQNRPGNDLIQEALRQQDQIGWFGVFNGFVSKQWTRVQHQHLLDCKSIKSAVLWMSRFQRRIWIIPWEQWAHRNKTLHEDHKLHATVIRAINDEITEEWNTGHASLTDNRHTHLFQGTLDQKLNLTPQLKQLWLASIWAARDAEERRNPTLGRRVRNTVAVDFYERWQERVRSI